MKDQKTFQIKSLIDEHTCTRDYNLGSLVTSTWIARQFGTKVRQNPAMKINDLIRSVMKKYQVKVTRGQCSRAKAKSLDEIQNKLVDHYSKLWDYKHEIERSNPGSTVKICVNQNHDGHKIFACFYVCFNGLKEGWVRGCRRVIGIDGCFLKGICQGELLSAVGRDANNQIYPIAWAVVGVENKENWSWFLKLVHDDLDLQSGNGLTIISDGYKGLIESVKLILPNVEHRHCARHICANFLKKWPGTYFRNQFWKASKASYDELFKRVMQDMKTANSEAFTYLMEKQPEAWSRAYFQTGLDCDAVENGISECFNSFILAVRRKPIIDMLEDIRHGVMTRIVETRSACEKWQDVICPNIRKQLEENKKIQRLWYVIPSGWQEFEVRCGDEAFTVDLDKKTCSCRAWQISGIPCPHGVSTIYYLNKDTDSFVSESFKKHKFNTTYSFNIRPVNGENIWSKTSNVLLLPPLDRRMPGRPTIKRKRHVTEGTRVSRVGKTMTCQNCLEVGHNIRTCKNPKKVSPQPVTQPRGRPRTNDMVQRDGRGGWGRRVQRSGRGGSGSTTGSGRKVGTKAWFQSATQDQETSQVEAGTDPFFDELFGTQFPYQTSSFDYQFQDQTYHHEVQVKDETILVKNDAHLHHGVERTCEQHLEKLKVRRPLRED